MTRILLVGILTVSALVLPRSAAAQGAASPEAMVEQAGLRLQEGISARSFLSTISLGSLIPGPVWLGIQAVESGLRGDQAAGNTAIVDQIGEGNQVYLVQEGRRNVAVAYQHGDDNIITAQQHGDSNVFGAWLVGSDNQLDVTQNGYGHRYLLGYIGDDLRPEAVVQNGIGNFASQFGIGGRLFGIRQQGNGVEVIIQHNPVVVPTSRPNQQ